MSSSNADAGPSAFELAVTGSPTMVGVYINFLLLGALGVQAYIYYLSFPRDPIRIQCLVVFLFLFEAAQTILLGYDEYRYDTIGFADKNFLGTVQNIGLSGPIMGGIVSFVVQVFFASRLWTIGKPKVLIGLIVAIGLMQCAGSVVTGVQAYQLVEAYKIPEVSQVPVIIWLVGSAVCDAIIAISMTVLLLSKRSSIFRQTNLVLTKLVALTVETGTITATFAVADLVLFLTYHKTTVYGALAVILGKLYSNTCLAVLNSRVKIWGGRDAAVNAAITASETMLQDTVRAGGPVAYRNAHRSLTTIEIGHPGNTDSIRLESYAHGKRHLDGTELTKADPIM